MQHGAEQRGVQNAAATIAYRATHSGTLYNPPCTGDYFGDSIAVRSNRLAVRAPFYIALIPALASGHVVIYER